MGKLTGFTKRLFEELSAAQAVDAARPHGVTIINALQSDRPVPGQVMTSEYGPQFRVIKCDMKTATVEDLDTEIQYVVNCSAIIVIATELGLHWHLQKRRNGLFPLGPTSQAAETIINEIIRSMGNRPANTLDSPAVSEPLKKYSVSTVKSSAKTSDLKEVPNRNGPKAASPIESDMQDPENIDPIYDRDGAKSGKELREEPILEEQVLQTEVAAVDSMVVLTDRAGHNLAQRMYKTYISGDDFTMFPKFMLELDALMVKYGANASGQDDGGELDVDEEIDVLSGESDKADYDTVKKVVKDSREEEAVESSVETEKSAVASFLKAITSTLESFVERKETTKAGDLVKRTTVSDL